MSVRITGAARPSVTDCVDPDSPLLVIKAIAALTVSGAVTGGTFGVLRSYNPYATAMNMSLNGTILGLSFYGIREYLVSPLLIQTLSGTSESYAYRLAQINPRAGEGPLAASDPIVMMRNNRLIDSAIAGAATGGILSGMARGLHSVPRAAFTASLVTTSLQYLVNSARIGRIEYLSAQSRRSQHVAAPVAPVRQPDSAFTDSRSEEVAQMHKTEVEGGRKTFPERMMDFLSKVSPVRKISDEEYLVILDKQKAELERSMASFAPDAQSEALPEKGNALWASLTSGFSPAETPQDIGQVVGELEGIERKIEALRVQIDKKADRAKVV